ncbi:MAG: ankyrin repeat domain-containing protein [Rudaea sp.]|uniref:ankyrin repeat domain-containing protein n=1 Tax=Rudaea sp. TaxID=2136325 RepID=UPI0039E3793E
MYTALHYLRAIFVASTLVMTQSACSVPNDVRNESSSGYDFMAAQIIRAAVTVKVEDVFYLGAIEIGKLADAAGHGDTKQMQRLVAQGVPVNGVGQRAMTPLLWALGQRNMAGFRWLLDHGADPNLVTCCDIRNSKLSPMNLAAAIEDSQYLQALLDHGGDANLVTDDVERTPIFSAVSFRRINNIELLAQHHANLNQVELDDITVMAFGHTPLQHALDSSQFEVALALLRAGANPCVKDRSGHTAMSGMVGRANSGTTQKDREAFPQIVEYLKKYTCN